MLNKKVARHLTDMLHLGCVSLGESVSRFVIPDHMDFSTPEETQNPKKDYFVITRQAGGTQYIYQNDISLVLP